MHTCLRPWQCKHCVLAYTYRCSRHELLGLNLNVENPLFTIASSIMACPLCTIDARLHATKESKKGRDATVRSWGRQRGTL